MMIARESVVAGLTWDEVSRRLEKGAAAVLPIGAGAKQHGLHLPMNTDQLQAEWLAGEIAAEYDALLWPALTYGYYPAFIAYAGSCSLGEDTFSSVVREITDGLIGFGARPVLILNTGLSTIGPVDKALAGLSAQAHHLKIHEGRRCKAAAARLGEQTYGSHADEHETARMLVLAPESVNMARAEASPDSDTFKPGAGPLTPHDPGSINYSRSGSFGDPTLATREKGEALLTAIREDVLEMAGNAIRPENGGDRTRPES